MIDFLIHPSSKYIPARLLDAFLIFSQSFSSLNSFIQIKTSFQNTSQLYIC